MKSSQFPRRSALVLFAAALWLGGMEAASAQVRVDLTLRRSIFVRYEPIIATVRVTNMTGTELELADEGNRKWFGFQIENTVGTPIPPYHADYQLSPVQIGPGQSIERAINITPLYPVTEFGTYRIKAMVFVRSLGKYFSSNHPLNIEITEGRMIGQPQTVGVPDGLPGAGEMRTITLLLHRLPETTQLYVRIEDKANGRVYCTHQLGRTVSFNKPEIEFSPTNTVNILQNTAPKAYMLTEIGLNGEVIQRKGYQAVNEKPSLRRNETTGEVAVVGGVFVDPNVPDKQVTPGVQPPSVGARPIAAPAPAE